jgi:hypothetical protein
LGLFYNIGTLDILVFKVPWLFFKFVASLYSRNFATFPII